MFTLKLYGAEEFRQVIRQADSFTILRPKDGHVEISAHTADGSYLYDLYAPNLMPDYESAVPIFARAIIENEKGRTTEMVWPTDPNGPGKIDVPPPNAR